MHSFPLHNSFFHLLLHQFPFIIFVASHFCDLLLVYICIISFSFSVLSSTTGLFLIFSILILFPSSTTYFINPLFSFLFNFVFLSFLYYSTARLFLICSILMLLPSSTTYFLFYPLFSFLFTFVFLFFPPSFFSLIFILRFRRFHICTILSLFSCSLVCLFP